MAPTHPSESPSMVFANAQGEIKDFPELAMAGRSATTYCEPTLKDLIPLPEGSELFVLPNRLPVGIDRQDSTPLLVDQNPDQASEGIQAVAAFMSPAHTAIHSAAYLKKQSDHPPLPLFAYTAVGWYKGQFWVSAFRSDADQRQDADQFNQEKIVKKTQKALQKSPRNRLIQHLGNCCLTYGCPAARNYFLGRWEAPLPTSPACNAQCVGCISLQPSGCCPSTQERITFIPNPKEIAEIAIPHLSSAPRPITSFGQGCEGEPLLQAEIIRKAIIKIRKATAQGTINLNTNASRPEEVRKLAEAGLDSIRVSMNSARPEFYQRYHRPKDFTFNEVSDSITVMKQADRFVSLNYFVLPGFTDDPDEFEAFSRLIDSRRPDLIQLRNLNMDPDWYFETLQHDPQKPAMGIRAWQSSLKERFPWLKYGYFNPPLR